MSMINATDGSDKKRTDEFPLNLAAGDAMMSLMRTVWGNGGSRNLIGLVSGENER